MRNVLHYRTLYEMGLASRVIPCMWFEERGGGEKRGGVTPFAVED